MALPRNGGACAAINASILRAAGEYVAILNSDDVFLPGAVAAAVEAFRTNPDAALVYGDVELIDEESRLIGADRQVGFNLAHYLGRFDYIPQPGTFFTRAALQVARGWREEYSYAADADFWLRRANLS